MTNGWTNRETWLIHLWMGEYLQEAIEEQGFTSPYETENFILEAIEIEVYGDPDNQKACLKVDLLETILAQVDLIQLAEHYLEEID